MSRAEPYKDEMLKLPALLSHGGLVLYIILFSSAVAVVVFIERFLHCHRAQINSTEFLNGVRTVLKRENVVEALSICDAPPGPVPAHAAYNYLVSRVNSIVLDMERAATEVVNIVTETTAA